MKTGQVYDLFFGYCCGKSQNIPVVLILPSDNVTAALLLIFKVMWILYSTCFSPGARVPGYKLVRTADVSKLTVWTSTAVPGTGMYRLDMCMAKQGGWRAKCCREIQSRVITAVIC